jgi:ABC-type uncharacterized transport system involved in gliding motility auxiliary subunit
MNGPIIDENGNNINIDNCCICLEKMENNKYKIPECKHEFHNECLLTYFRVSNNTSCPLCRNIRQSSSNLKTILNYSRRKNANKKIVNEVKKYKEFQLLEKEIKKEFKEFKRTHKEILDKRIKLLRKKREYGYRVRRMKFKLMNMVALPLIITR